MIVGLSLVAIGHGAKAGNEPYVWRSYGPTSGAILALVADPTDPLRVYAGSARGSIFRSTDGGETWMLSSLPFTGVLAEVRALVVDPIAPALVYAGTSAGVFKSVDGGRTWAPTRLGDLNVHALAIDPAVPAILYAGSDEGALYKSSDGGGSWAKVAGLVANRAVTAVAVDPRTPSTVYAGLDRGRVFRSTDGGTSWNHPGFDGITANEFRSLLIDPLSPSTLYACSERGVFRSTNAGLTFFPANNGLTSTDAKALAQDPLTPATLYAWSDGIFKSTDGGNSWRRSGPLGSGTALAIHPLAPATLFAGGDGVLRSRDGGATWRRSNRGLADSIISAVAVNPRTPSILYAGGNDVFKSVDGGGSWRALQAELPGFVTALAVDPAEPRTVYAGTGLGVYRSTDEGVRWSRAGPTRFITALTASVTTRNLIYAGTADQGLVKSTDGGNRWSRTNSSMTEGTFVNAIAIGPATTPVLFIGTQKSFYGSAFRSLDGGSMWEVLPIPQTATQRIDVQAIATHSQGRGVVYAGTSAGLFMSEDDGATWSAELLEGRSVAALTVNPAHPTTLYAGTPGDGVFASEDGGKDWEAINDGLINGNVEALAVNPLRPRTLYAGTAGGGVFVFGQVLPCDGDCNGDVEVTVDELLIMVNITTGSGSVSQCLQGDLNGDREITVDEILAAVAAGLTGCERPGVA
ncbi:hypothetical protein L6Q96_13955 [Candidatus Binatia bacterium]|nr:hypothetical protein [Candidatus Binatia bacterium]